VQRPQLVDGPQGRRRELLDQVRRHRQRRQRSCNIIFKACYILRDYPGF
jgi:hypothetical protein